MGYQEKVFIATACMVFGLCALALAFAGLALAWDSWRDSLQSRRLKAKRKAWDKARRQRLWS